MRSLLAAQQTFVDRLVHLMKAVQRESGNRKKKVSPQSSPLMLPYTQIPLFASFLGTVSYMLCNLLSPYDQ
jgi:hypothetical protein